MSQKILAVFGATGQQGGSVINFVLNDPELSQQYRIRALTRDVSSAKAQQLLKVGSGNAIEVVAADVLDPTSISSALTGASAVFAMTTPAASDPNPLEAEFAAARTIADAAVAAGVGFLVFSTLPSPSAISGGKYTKVFPFEAKARAERYIRDLPVRSAFFCPGSFMENFATQGFLAPKRSGGGNGGEGTWVLARHSPTSARMPWVAVVPDTGKFVGAMLAEPERFAGKTMCAATALYSYEEVAGALTEATGRTVVAKQVPLEEFKASLPILADVLVEGLSYQDEFGYYGEGTEELVAWSAGNARGKLTTLEEYLMANPPKLE